MKKFDSAFQLTSFIKNVTPLPSGMSGVIWNTDNGIVEDGDFILEWEWDEDGFEVMIRLTEKDNDLRYRKT